MKRLLVRLALATTVGAFALIGVDVVEKDSASGPSEDAIGITLTPNAASARPARRVARRTARRTSRRVNRRHNYYYALPTGCAWRAPYHYCGGVYYEKQVVEGETVYIIVYP
ncbi:MAG: hypothetical protein AAGD13_24295 [Pseudomonadota bacterium]